MGFKLQHEINETGISGEYWHEMSLEYNMIKGYVTFNIGFLPASKAALLTHRPILTKFFEIPEGTNPQLAAGGKAFLLGYIRALPEFNGSQDV